MKKFSLKEFEEFCASLGAKEFSFDTAQQDWDSIFIPMKMKMTYHTMIITINPNIICFKQSGGDVLYFNSVKHINLLERGNGVYKAVIDIVCGSARSDKDDISYRIIIA